MAAIPNITYSPGQPMQDFFDIVNQTIDAVNEITATNVLATKIITATWDADANATISLAHGLPDYTKIIYGYGKVVANDGTPIPIIWFNSTGDTQVWQDLLDATNIRLRREASGILDAFTWNAANVKIILFYEK